MTEPVAVGEAQSGECLALAYQHCSLCFGLGRKPFGRAARMVRCSCVLRSIFRACHRRFEHLSRKDPGARCSSVYRGDHKASGRKPLWGYVEQEYCADFCAIAKRTLGEDTVAYKIFKFHFLYGADWKLCTRRLNIDRGNFFHELYRIEEKLGSAYRDTKPYSLFPLDEYFGVVARGVKKRSSLAAETLSDSSFALEDTERSGGPLRPPLVEAGAAQ